MSSSGLQRLREQLEEQGIENIDQCECGCGQKPGNCTTDKEYYKEPDQMLGKRETRSLWRD